MSQSVKCPSCGHRVRLPEDTQAKRLKCMVCNEVLTVPANKARRGMAASGTPNVETHAVPSFLKKAFGDQPQAIDGAIAGASAGVAAGVVSIILAGIVMGQLAGEII